MCALALGAAAACAGCGSNPTSPGAALTLSCPAAQSVQAANGVSAVVSFPPAVASGGVEPVTLACTPSSGATFEVGSSTVTCTARDAKQHSASCAFQVTVSAPPALMATKFVAFGDSITEGVLDPPCGTVTTNEYGWNRQEAPSELALLKASVNIATSYPSLLQGLLSTTYTAQSIVVINEGQAGERVEDGVTRLPGVLTADAPQVLLLQEGINNINSNNPASIPVVVNGLRTMIRTARGRGVTVFVGTLLPERSGSCRGYAPSLVAPADDAIRNMVTAEGAYLVDLFNAFGGVAGDLIGVDGLHPNAAGYQKMADTFFTEIRNRLEKH